MAAKLVGLDTNVLLRGFVNDDPIQSAAARRLLSDADANAPKFVCIVVIVEFAWALDRTFGYSRQSVIEAVRQILEASDTIVENRERVAACLSYATSANADLADLLIARGNLEAGRSHTVTFDKKAARRVPGMELLA